VQLINWLLATDGEGTGVNLLMNAVHSSKRAQGSRGRMVPMSIKQQTKKVAKPFCHSTDLPQHIRLTICHNAGNNKLGRPH